MSDQTSFCCNLPLKDGVKLQMGDMPAKGGGVEPRYANVGEEYLITYSLIQYTTDLR